MRPELGAETTTGPSDDAVIIFSFDGKTLALANNMNNLHEHHILHTTYKLYW